MTLRDRGRKHTLAAPQTSDLSPKMLAGSQQKQTLLSPATFICQTLDKKQAEDSWSDGWNSDLNRVGGAGGRTSASLETCDPRTASKWWPIKRDSSKCTSQCQMEHLDYRKNAKALSTALARKCPQHQPHPNSEPTRVLPSGIPNALPQESLSHHLLNVIAVTWLCSFIK